LNACSFYFEQLLFVVRELLSNTTPNASALAFWRNLENRSWLGRSFSLPTAKLQKLIRITNAEALFVRRHNANAMLAAALIVFS